MIVTCIIGILEKNVYYVITLYPVTSKIIRDRYVTWPVRVLPRYCLFTIL